MSTNIVNTKGHHTYNYEPPHFNDAGAPVFSKITSKDGETHFPFLGEGFYFWDDNINRAKLWGEQRYKGRYHIKEYHFELKGDSFLDLVGSRQDLFAFYTIARKIWARFGKMPIGQTICFLQNLEKSTPGTFPFKIIRALNVKTHRNTIPFNSDNGIKSTFLLDPEMIICFFDQKDIPIDCKIC